MEKDIVYPLVSVIIPTYNAENYILDTIQSVLDQTYPNIEIIIIDDASTDQTIVKLKSIRTNRPLNITVQLINAGAAAARNTGYALSKGKLIKFLDGDDLINPQMIDEQVKLAINNPDAITSGKWGRFYHNDLHTFKLNPEECWQTLPSADWICTSWKHAQSMTNPGIFLIPRDIIDAAGLWDENLSLLDDTPYFAKTILQANKVIFCEDAILYYRSGISGSLSGSKNRKGILSAYMAIEKATAALLAKRNDNVAQISCANIWKLFVYDIYPLHADLATKAYQHLNKLVKPTLPFPAGGYSKLLLPVLGWKLIKRLQLLKKSF